MERVQRSRVMGYEDINNQLLDFRSIIMTVNLNVELTAVRMPYA